MLSNYVIMNSPFYEKNWENTFIPAQSEKKQGVKDIYIETSIC